MHLGFVLNQTGRTGHLPNRADCVSSMKSDGGCDSLFENSVNTHNSSSTAGVQIKSAPNDWKSSGLFSWKLNHSTNYNQISAIDQ